MSRQVRFLLKRRESPRVRLSGTQQEQTAPLQRALWGQALQGQALRGQALLVHLLGLQGESNDASCQRGRS